MPCARCAWRRTSIARAAGEEFREQADHRLQACRFIGAHQPFQDPAETVAVKQIEYPVDDFAVVVRFSAPLSSSPASIRPPMPRTWAACIPPAGPKWGLKWGYVPPAASATAR